MAGQTKRIRRSPANRRPTQPRKREREIRIQGWFDTADEADVYVLKVAEATGLNGREFIRRAAHALAQVENLEVSLPENTSVIESKMSRVEKMLEMIVVMMQAGAVIGSTPEATQAMAAFQADYQELSPTEINLAQGYRSFVIEDEDEINE